MKSSVQSQSPGMSSLRDFVLVRLKIYTCIVFEHVEYLDNCQISQGSTFKLKNMYLFFPQINTAKHLIFTAQKFDISENLIYW